MLKKIGNSLEIQNYIWLLQYTSVYRIKKIQMNTSNEVHTSYL